MPAFKLEMDDRTLKSAYVLMAHDTSHDFFQPKETFRKVISRRGRLEGGADDDMDEDLSPTPRGPSPPGMIPEDDDMDEDLSPSPRGMIPEEDDIGEVIPEYIGDADEVKWWSIDDDMVPEGKVPGDKDDEREGGHRSEAQNEALANIEISIKQIQEFKFHLDELSDIYDFILISKMKNEAEEVLRLALPGTDLDLIVEASEEEEAEDDEDDEDDDEVVIQELKDDMEPETPETPETPANQTGDTGRENLGLGPGIGSGEQTGSGSIRGAMRRRRVREDVLDKWKQVRGDYKPIMDRVVSWDNIVFKLTLEKPPAEEVGKLNSVDIDRIREENERRGGGKYDKNRLYTFFEWYNIKKKKSNTCDFLDTILEEDVGAVGWETHARLFSVLLSKKIDDDCPDGFTASKLDILLKWINEFIKYANSGENGKMDVIDFLKKKWRTVKGVAATLIQKLNGKLSKPLLTVRDTQNIVKLRDEIMKWWIIFIYGELAATNMPGSRWAIPGWVISWINLVDQPGGNITDDKMREEYLKNEFKWSSPKQLKVGFYHFPDLPPALSKLIEVRKSNYGELQEVARKAYDDKAVGNNVALTSHFHKTATKRPEDVRDWLFETSRSYNCNAVNVADPGSICPKVDGGGGDFEIELHKSPAPAGSEAMFSGKIAVGRSSDLSDSVFSYKIRSPQEDNDVKLEVRNHHFGNDGPLSKLNILEKVFQKIKSMVEGDNYSAILDNWLGGDEVPRNIKEIIEIFCLKMWGDHAQELFSVQQSYEKPDSVFVGNDWISTLRYFHYQKYAQSVSQEQKKKWWGGFMGPSALLMVSGITASEDEDMRQTVRKPLILQPSPKKPKKPKKKKKTKKKSKKKSKKKTKKKKKSKKKSKKRRH